MKIEWLRCPVCGNKTRNRIREDTAFKNYPLYCPKCKQVTLIEAENLKITVIKKQERESHMYAAVYGENHCSGFICRSASVKGFLSRLLPRGD